MRTQVDIIFNWGKEKGAVLCLTNCNDPLTL
jgi:hypothetical protein